MFLQRLSNTLVGIVILYSAWGAEVQSSPLENKKNELEQAELLAPLEFGVIYKVYSPRCAGESNGYITVDIQPGTGGVSPYSYRYQKNGGTASALVSNQPSSFNISNLSAGDYDITIFDSSLPTPQQVTITVPVSDNPNLILSLDPVSNPTCAGGKVDLKFRASGGSGSGYTYSLYTNGELLDAANSTGEFYGKGAGKYSAMVTDGRGCPKNYSTLIEIGVPQVIDISHTIVNQITCKESTASVKINGIPTDNKTYPFTIEVRNTTLNKTYSSNTNYTFSGLETGDYTVSLFRNNCPTDRDVTTFTINEFKPVTITATPASGSVQCYGDLTSVSVKIEGGTASSMVKAVLDNNDGLSNDPSTSFFNYGETHTIDNVPVGSYTLRWVDQYSESCTGSIPYLVSGPDKLEYQSAPTSTPALCFGSGFQGKIKISVKGGTPGSTGYKYFIDNVQVMETPLTTVEIERPGGASYSVFVRDSKGCETEVRTVKIDQPSILTVVNDVQKNRDVTCPGGSDGQIHLAITGGNGQYSFAMTGTQTLNDEADSLSYYVNNLKAGTYNFIVKDKNGCTATALNDIKISQDDPVSIEQWSLLPVKCNNGTTELKVKAKGGPASTYTYQLLRGTTLIGTQTSNQLCSFTGLSGGVDRYTLSIASGSCTPIDTTFAITNPKKLTLSSFNPEIKVTCPGDKGTFTLIVADGEAPYRYVLNNGSDTINFASTATINNLESSPEGKGKVHFIDVLDKVGCKTTISIWVLSPQAITNSPVIKTDVLCRGASTGTIKFAVSGGTPGYTAVMGTYTAPTSSDSIRFVNIPAGTYSITLKDSKECPLINPIPVTIGEPSTDFKIPANGIQNTTILCYGDSSLLTVQANGGNPGTIKIVVENRTSKAKWSSSSTNQFMVPAGTYDITATNADGCIASSSGYVINEPLPLNVTLAQSEVLVKCPGDKAEVILTITGEPLFKYSLDNGVTKHDFDLTTGGNSLYSVSGLEASYEGITHVITIYDKNSCSKQVQVKVREPKAFEVGDPVYKPVVCKGGTGSVSLFVSGGTQAPTYSAVMGTYTTTTSDDSIRFSKVLAGVYTMNITDSKGCLVAEIKDIKVEEPEKTFAITISDNKIKCFGGEAVLTVKPENGWKGNYTVSVNGTSSSTTYDFPVKEGYYAITASDIRGCKIDTTYLVKQPDKLVIKVTNKKNVTCSGYDDAVLSFKAEGGTKPYFYGFNGLNSADLPFSGDTTITGGLEAISYQLIASDINKCQSEVVTVKIDEPKPVTFSIARVDSVHCYGGNNGRIWVKAAEGGTAPYKYYLEGPNALSVMKTDGVFSDLKVGSYSVSVKDSLKCPSVPLKDTVIVYGPTSPITIIDAKMIEEVSCNGKKDARVKIDAMGGEPYTLRYRVEGTDVAYSSGYGSSPIIQGLGAGHYRVWVRNNMERCETSKDASGKDLIVEVKDQLPVIYSSKVKNDFVCHNDPEKGSATVIASGGVGDYTYNLLNSDKVLIDSNKEGKFTELGTINAEADKEKNTNYVIQAVDSNLCASEYYEFTIKNPSKVEVTFIKKEDVTCVDKNDGKITISISGGLPGTTGYSFYDADNNKFTFSKKEGNEYLITDLSGTQFYQVIAKDGNLCSDTIIPDIQIINPPKLLIADVIAGEKRCNNSTDDRTIIKIDKTYFGTKGNYQFSFNGGESFQSDSVLTNSRSKIIRPLVKDINGCTATFDTIQIEWPEKFTVTDFQNKITCWDNQYGTLTLEFQGGIDPYYVSIDDPLFGDSIPVFKATNQPTTIDTIGKGEELFLYGGSGYRIYIKDANNCPAENKGLKDAYDLFGTYKWNPVDTVYLMDVEIRNPACAYQKGIATYVLLNSDSVDGPFKYWAQDNIGTEFNKYADNNSDGIIDGLPVDIDLFFFVQERNGCVPYNLEYPGFDYMSRRFIPDNDTISINNFQIVEQPECSTTKDGKIKFDIDYYQHLGIYYKIDMIDTTNVVSEDSLSGQKEYFVLVDSLYGTKVGIDVAVDSLKKSDEPSESSWNYWYFTTHDVKNKFKVGTYNLKVTDVTTGCYVERQFSLKEQFEICPDTILGNVFTPNYPKDSINNEWIITKSERINVSLRIFNAHGELVYEYKGLVPEDGLKWNGTVDWDGTDKKGRPVPFGTYMYIYYPDAENTADVRTGTITILRNR